MRTLFYIIASLFLLASCDHAQDPPAGDAAVGERLPVRYARGFYVEAFPDHYRLVIRDPLDTLRTTATYILSKEQGSAGANSADVSIPIAHMVSLSTTHIGFLTAIGHADALVGFSGTQYICDTEIQSLVASGKIAEVGTEGGLDLEKIVSLQPDIVMTYQTGNAAYDNIEKLRSIGLTPVINNEFKELTPLGQAEWIKCIALFFDAWDVADSIFRSVEADYLAVSEKAMQSAQRPTVFTGMAFKGEWTIPGGQSFAARYFQDAGATYLWAEDTRTGNFPIAFSAVLERAVDADLWLHPGAAESLSEITAADPRYRHFAAWQKGQVFNNNLRQIPDGGNDYWEKGIVYPNLVLRDLVAIFHPELMPAHTFTFYRQIP